MIKIILKKRREESLKRFHPWIFSGAIADIERVRSDQKRSLSDTGDIAEVYSFEGEFLGCGHYQAGSIAVRILSFDNSALLPDFWEGRIMEAYLLRNSLNLIDNSGTDSYRLIHGEGDNLPGLIVDIYKDVAVLQAHSAGMYQSLNKIADALRSVYGQRLRAIYNKSSATAPFRGELDATDCMIYGENLQSAIIKENGLSFSVDWVNGQKTGFFLDQRENRELLKRYSKDKEVLNLFSYTGGFSIYAMSGGATKVTSVDSSKTAMDQLNRNIELNIGGCFENHCEEAISFLRRSEESKYDLIVVDPPAFAKHRDAVRNAVNAYRRLNADAIGKVASGGIIFTFSCSQAIDKITFAETIFTAAASVKRKVKILHRLCQPPDHPVNIYHPEGEYLKGLVLWVE